MSARGLIELEKEGMFGSVKVGGLDFCEHCVNRKQLGLSLASCLIQLRRYLAMYTPTCGDGHKGNLLVEVNTSSHLLMIVLGRFGSTF